MKFNYCVWLIPRLKHSWSRYTNGFQPHLTIKSKLSKSDAVLLYTKLRLDKPLKVKLVGDLIYEVKDGFHSLYYLTEPVYKNKKPEWYPENAHISFRYKYNETFSKSEIKEVKNLIKEKEAELTDFKLVYCNEHFLKWHYLE